MIKKAILLFAFMVAYAADVAGQTTRWEDGKLVNKSSVFKVQRVQRKRKRGRKIVRRKKVAERLVPECAPISLQREIIVPLTHSSWSPTVESRLEELRKQKIAEFHALNVQIDTVWMEQQAKLVAALKADGVNACEIAVDIDGVRYKMTLAEFVKRITSPAQ